MEGRGGANEWLIFVCWRWMEVKMRRAIVAERGSSNMLVKFCVVVGK